MNNRAMHDLLRLPSTDPTAIYRHRDGLYGTDLLAAALAHLDFFSWLDKHPSSLEGICEGLQLKRRPADVMLTLFTAMGFLEHRGEVFQLTPMAKEHLVAGSPWFIGPYYASLKERPVTKDFVAVLKTDRVANWGSFKDEKDWVKAMEDEVFAASFTAAMDCRGVYLGQAAARRLNLLKRKKLLDIGGGSGIYACSIVAHHPQMRAAVFEKPPVDQVARKAIGERGFSDRVEVIAGDMFKDALPRGFDAHLISNVLHDWDEAEVRAILKGSVEALEPGGLLVIHDAYINAEKTGPLPVAAYSAMLMHSTPGKCYSTREMQGFLEELGFLNFHFETTAADRGIVTAVKP